jgi:calcium-translocating P-type ATPase
VTRASAHSPTAGPAAPEDAAYARAPDDVALTLESDELHGLSEAEAANRLDRYGPNELRRADRPAYLRIAVRQLTDPLTVLLLAAAVVSAAIGERFEAGVIAAIVVLNAVLGFFQEAGAERALLALRRTVELSAAVVRGSRERSIAAAELVRGDLIVVREGDRVPADARIVASERLDVDESALTGESAPVEKSPETVPDTVTLAERTSMLYAGTAVTRGRGRALVTAAGEETELGNIARLASAAKPPLTPLQRRLGALSRAMIGLGLGVMGVLAAGMLLRGASIHEAFLVGVSVAVAAVPEGLAATVTIALAQGARGMAARGAIVRRLTAVETLGSASVIATDKTGTLTINRLRVVAIEPATGASDQEVLVAGVLASTAELVEEGDDVRIAGDHVDGAFLLAAREQGLADARPAPEREFLLEHPFDPVRKRLTVVYEEGGSRRVVVKGALETLFARALLGEDERARLVAHADEWARRGLRVLAVAERGLPDAALLDDEVDTGLTVLGLTALQDPLRPAAADAVRAARAAGIGVTMLTGDHPLTAATIGEQIGLGNGSPLTGSQLDSMDDSALEQAAADHAVFARVTPTDKLKLVEAYQRRGEVVAVTGDGVNDTPALRRADVGIAMGRSGTEAAREGSDIVLTDDDFATIVAAIEEGRRIGDNVRKFVAFLLSANLGEIVLFAIAVLGGLGVPMTVVQVLTVNLVTDGLPAVALARDPAARGTMRRKPRPQGRLLGRDLEVALGLAGVTIGLAATAAYLTGRALAPEAAQTMAFATIALAELLFVFSVRSPHAPVWRGPRNPALVASVVLSAAVVAFLIYFAPVQNAFGTVSLGARELALVFGLAALPTILVELAKAVRRRRRR